MIESQAPFRTTVFEQLAAVEASNWWFCARNRVLLWVLSKQVKSFRSFLEVGCGTGFVLEGICAAYPSAELFGTEYFEEGLVFARDRVPSASFAQLDATVMEQTECYDVIGAFDVIEHIEQDEKVLSNLVRALKRGGAVDNGAATPLAVVGGG